MGWLSRDTFRSLLVLPHDGVRAEALMQRLRLDWFIRLRWLFIISTSGALAIERRLVHSPARPFGLIVTLALLGAVNLLWSLLSRRLPDLVVPRDLAADSEHIPSVGVVRVGRTTALANGQIAADLLFLTVMLRYLGGAESPLVGFYLFHVVICAMLLTPLNALLQSLWAIALYSVMVAAEYYGWTGARYPFLAGESAAGVFARDGNAWTMFLVVTAAILGVLYFTTQIAARLDIRERELHHAYDALEASSKAIHSLQQRRSQFMRTAAHQLKAPLAVVETMVSLLRDGVVPPERVQETHEKIIHRCQEGMVQVGELLALARVQDADAARHSAASTDAGQIAARLCQKFLPLAQRKQVTLRLHASTDVDLRVRVEATDLENCLSNLIDNAIKYTPGSGRVDVSITRIDQCVRARVEDTGIGIDDATRHELFDAYRRGNAAIAAGIPGTGLGLSIVREVVEQCGGSLTVESKPNEGSTFVATFPAACSD